MNSNAWFDPMSIHWKACDVGSRGGCIVLQFRSRQHNRSDYDKNRK
jgi:hypothetical protein